MPVQKTTTNERLFIGCYPTGLVYADRKREKDGDYVRLAYLNYGTLVLEFDKGILIGYRKIDPVLIREVERHALYMQSLRGQKFAIAGNATVILGDKS